MATTLRHQINRQKSRLRAARRHYPDSPLFALEILVDIAKLLPRRWEEVEDYVERYLEIADDRNACYYAGSAAKAVIEDLEFALKEGYDSADFIPGWDE